MASLCSFVPGPLQVLVCPAESLSSAEALIEKRTSGGGWGQNIDALNEDSLTADYS